MNQIQNKKFSIQSHTGCLSEQDAKRYFTVVGFAMFALMLVYYGSSMLLSWVLFKVAPTYSENAIVSHLLSLVPLYGFAVPVFWGILRRLPKGIPSGESAGVGLFFGAFGMAVIMMMAGNYVGQFLIQLFEMLSGATLVNPVEAVTAGSVWWVNLIFVALIPCVLEELVFRKLLCDRLLPLGEGYAVLISAVAFGLVHGNFFQFFYAFGVGLIFAAVYVKTGKIWMTMIYHGIINVLGGVLAPWILERISPLLEESVLNQMTEYVAENNLEALVDLIRPYLLPMMGLLAYEGIMMLAMIGGTVYFFVRGRKVRFQQGLLPVPKECRVSAVLLNVGTAAALTVFTAVFLFSLL